MPSANATGTQAATVTTEHTLETETVPNTYVLEVDLNPMQAADAVELRVYDKVLSGSTSRVVFYEKFTGVQGEAQGGPVKVSIPIPVIYEGKATLKQTAGTGRSFDWKWIQL